jgi:hypothetical protein
MPAVGLIHGLLVVVLEIKVDDLDLFVVNAECKPPVLRDEQAPRPFTPASQLMRLPARDVSEFALALHVPKRGHHEPELGDGGGLDCAGVILLDQAAQTFVKTFLIRIIPARWIGVRRQVTAYTQNEILPQVRSARS